MFCILSAKMNKIKETAPDTTVEYAFRKWESGDRKAS